MSQRTFSAFKQSRWYKRLLWALAALLGYTGVGFFVVPPLLKWQLLKRLPDLTHRRAAVRQVKLNPWTLSLTIRGLSLTETDGRPFASWEELYVNFQASSLFRWAWTFKEIRLQRPAGEVILLKDGRLNLANLFESRTPAASKPSASSIPRINIFHLQITNGFVGFEDQTRRSRFRTEYRPINLEVTQFTTRPEANAPYSFRAEWDAGRSVTWAGELTVQPVRSAGHLEVNGVQFNRYQPYLQDFTRAVLTNGVADLQVSYRFEAGTNGVDLVLTNGLIHVEQVQVRDPDTGETLLGVRGFDVQQARLNLRERAVRVGRVKLSGATLLARVKQNKHLNLLDLVTLPAGSTNSTVASAAPAVPWTLTVADFIVEQAAVTLEDLTRRTPFKTQLEPIDASLKEFSNQPGASARYSFHVTTESAETLAGDGTLSINPVRSTGELKLAAVRLQKYMPYAEDRFRGNLSSGQLEVDAPYYFALGTNGLQAGVSNLAVTVSGLEVKAPGTDQTVVRLAQVGLDRVEANLEERRARVGSVRATGGSVLARRARDGSINLLGLIAQGSTNPPPQDARAPSAGLPGWEVKVDEVALKDYTLNVEDQQPPKPAAFRLDQIAVNLKDVSLASNAPIAATLSLRCNETGTLAVRGTAQLAPLAADLRLELNGLDLRAVQPYLEQFVGLGIVRGALRTDGQVRYQGAKPGTPRLTFAGNLGVTNFLCTDQMVFKELMRWDDLAVSGIECGLLPNSLKIGEVKWVAPKTSVIIGTNRQPNLTLILHRADSNQVAAVAQTAPAQAAAPASGGAFPLEVGVIRLERAALAFTDESIQPHASVGLQELSGTIRGLSSDLSQTAEVDLAGKVDQQSPFGIKGRIRVLTSDLFVDLTMTNANTQLTPFTPYLEKYAGHPLNKGRLSTALRYQIEKKQLKAENKIQIDQLTLGPRNNSPDATSLPVKLGVALLKDSNGRIELEVPMDGRLDDPQFSVGPIVLKVIVNLLVKAAASPFKLLGALVGGGEELSFVQFSPGTTNVVDGELDKLGKLTKALTQRPALNLEIEGGVDPVADRQALATQKLHDRLIARRLQELSAKGKAPASAETFQIEPEEYDRLLRGMFAEQFGTNVAAILHTNQVALAATNQPAVSEPAKGGPRKGPNFVQRVLGVFGVGKYGRRPPAQKALGKADRLALDQASPTVMEKLLAGTIVISDSDYRSLMEARARWVQDWLVQNGKVATDRILLVAPKLVEPANRGESRASLSLD